MVAAPILSALGLEAAALPTAVLSSQTGAVEYYSYLDMSAEILKILECWRKNGIKFDGIMTGYLGKPEIAELVPSIIEEFAKEGAVIAVDPVLGDGGELYGGFDESMTAAVRKLLPYANYLKPNQTEMTLLTGETDPEVAARALRSCGATVLVSGVERAGKIGVRLYSDEGCCEELRPKSDGFFHGAGDVLFAVFAGLVFSGVSDKKALSVAVDFTTKGIKFTAESGRDTREGVIFEPFIKELIKGI